MLKPKTREWHEERRKYLGGSDANIIINGSDQDRYDLWLIKTGQSEPLELLDVFQVQLGIFTEPFNLAWFTKKTGFELAENPGRFVATNGWMACQPDGMLDGAVIECKHTAERFSMDECVGKYQPQLHHSMICTQKKRAYLSVIRGNTYDYQEVEFDPDYASKLLLAEREFWECVTLGMPPGPGAPIPPPEAVKTIDMTGNNQWADAAAEWFACSEFSKRFDKAANTLRSLVTPDVKQASGHGIMLKRDKRGALRISEVKNV